MKDIRPALYALLVGDPTVSSLVGGSRIYPVRLPQGDRGPSLVYHRITGLVEYEMNGSAGLLQTLMQLDAIATSADAATQLGNAVHDVLSGYRGTVFFGTASPQNSVVVQGIFQTNERDIYDAPTEMTMLQRDYSIWYGEF